MPNNQSLHRKINSLKKKVGQLPEAQMDFSKVPSDILRRIAYPGEGEELTEPELSEILRKYEVIRAKE